MNVFSYANLPESQCNINFNFYQYFLNESQNSFNGSVNIINHILSSSKPALKFCWKLDCWGNKNFSASDAHKFQMRLQKAFGHKLLGMGGDTRDKSRHGRVN